MRSFLIACLSPPITKESDNGRLQESSRICIIGGLGSEPDRLCRCDAAPDQCRDDEVDGRQSRNADILARKSGLGSRSGRAPSSAEPSPAAPTAIMARRTTVDIHTNPTTTTIRTAFPFRPPTTDAPRTADTILAIITTGEGFRSAGTKALDYSSDR